MNEISKFNQVAFRSYASPVQQNTVTNPITQVKENTETKNDFYINQQGVEALKANIVISNPIDITKPISVDDYETKLQKAGMQKGKDYEIMPHQDGGQSIYVIDKNGHPIKFAIWQNGTGADCYDGCTNLSYPDNDDISSVSTTYDKYNVLESKEVRYKDIEKHKDLFPENIDMNTTADKYINFLKENNVNHEVEQQDNNGNKTTFVVEADKDGNLNKMTTFNEYADGAKMIGQSNTPTEKGNLVHDVSIISDGPYSELIVSDYLKG